MEPSEPRQLAASAPVPPTGDADPVDVPNPLSLLDGLREDHTETLTESGELLGTPDWDQWLLDRFVHEHESEEQMCEPSDAESASGALSTGLGAGAIPLDAQDALRQEASEIRSAAEMEVLAGEPYNRAGFERLLQSSFQSLDFEKPKFFLAGRVLGRGLRPSCFASAGTSISPPRSSRGNGHDFGAAAWA